MKVPPSIRVVAGLAAVLTGCAPGPGAAGGTDRPVAAATEVFVVRHAERVSNTDRDSPLSETGHARARALADALADADVEAVLTSQFVRTIETARPLAELMGIAPVVEPVEDADASSRAVAHRVLREHAGETVLIVGHSNTVPAIISALGGADIGPLTESDYDDLFLVIVRPDGEVSTVRSRYGRPD